MFFGLYYLLLDSPAAWKQVQPFIPFSRQNTEILRQRFRDVTISTLIGTGLTATVQGVLVGLLSGWRAFLMRYSGES